MREGGSGEWGIFSGQLFRNLPQYLLLLVATNIKKRNDGGVVSVSIDFECFGSSFFVPDHPGIVLIWLSRYDLHDPFLLRLILKQNKKKILNYTHI